MPNLHGVDFSAAGARLDRDWLWHELTEHAYWAKYRTRDMFEQQLDSAWRVVGAYRAVDGRMVGFCRAFSDGAAMAYLADLYVSREERGLGIGQELLRVMIDNLSFALTRPLRRRPVRSRGICRGWVELRQLP